MAVWGMVVWASYGLSGSVSGTDGRCGSQQEGISFEQLAPIIVGTAL